eukprot:TRINITY_DN17448_c0_g1_i1.p1 TRINITY_DN17448_c0_g1~~TRINITY_DN17448_c0_g1_i1.p1  ORF type:complete len:162 (-),score=32.73 TRINITY_DN17448_c0_g1_i1:26-511(-)
MADSLATRSIRLAPVNDKEKIPVLKGLISKISPFVDVFTDDGLGLFIVFADEQSRRAVKDYGSFTMLDDQKIDILDVEEEVLLRIIRENLAREKTEDQTMTSSQSLDTGSRLLKKTLSHSTFPPRKDLPEADPFNIILNRGFLYSVMSVGSVILLASALLS